MRKKTIDTIPISTDSIRSILASFSNSRSLPASLKQRSKIVLLASAEFSNQDIAKKVGLHYNNVATWRNRFLTTLPLLNEIELASPEKLLEKKSQLKPHKNPLLAALYGKTGISGNLCQESK